MIFFILMFVVIPPASEIHCPFVLLKSFQCHVNPKLPLPIFLFLGLSFLLKAMLPRTEALILQSTVSTGSQGSPCTMFDLFCPQQWLISFSNELSLISLLMVMESSKAQRQATFMDIVNMKSITIQHLCESHIYSNITILRKNSFV